MIPGRAVILLPGAFYAYLIGGAAKRRSRSRKRIKLVALLPFFPKFAVSLGFTRRFSFCKVRFCMGEVPGLLVL
jgi:hypothetical protein